MPVHLRSLCFVWMLPLALLVRPAYGGVITFTFSASVDASGFGLGPSVPVTITYSYDPALAPLGIVGTSRAEYGIGDVTYLVGSNTLVAHSLVSIDNDNPTYHDSLQLSAADNVSYGSYQTSVTGQINGFNVFAASFDIFDDQTLPDDMFSSMSLPPNTDFMSHAATVRVAFRDYLNVHSIWQTYTSPTQYTYTASEAAVPEPTLLCLLGTGLLAAGMRRMRERR